MYAEIKPNKKITISYTHHDWKYWLYFRHMIMAVCVIAFIAQIVLFNLGIEFFGSWLLWIIIPVVFIATGLITIDDYDNMQSIPLGNQNLSEKAFVGDDWQSAIAKNVRKKKGSRRKIGPLFAWKIRRQLLEEERAYRNSGYTKKVVLKRSPQQKIDDPINNEWLDRVINKDTKDSVF